MLKAEMDVRREARESVLIEIKRLRAAMRSATDPGAARALDGLLRKCEDRLAKMRETLATN